MMSASLALEHRYPCRRVRHADDREVFHVHRPVVAVECLEFEPGPWFLRHQLVGAGADRLLGEPILSDLLVIFGRHDPAGAAHIRCPDQAREIEERCLEIETNGALVDDVDTVGAFV